MDAISQTTLSNAFSWMKMLEFRLKFPWSLFIRGQLTIFQHWFRWWLGADQTTSHYLNQWWLDYRRIYASLGLNELNILSEMGSWSTLAQIAHCLTSTVQGFLCAVNDSIQTFYSLMTTSICVVKFSISTICKHTDSANIYMHTFSYQICAGTGRPMWTAILQTNLLCHMRD